VGEEEEVRLVAMVGTVEVGQRRGEEGAQETREVVREEMEGTGVEAWG